MERRTVRLRVRDGLHARPCCLIAETMRRFRGALTIRLGDRDADARSVLELMTLAAGAGATLDLVAEGDDAPAILDAIARLFEGRFEGLHPP